MAAVTALVVVIAGVVIVRVLRAPGVHTAQGEVTDTKSTLEAAQKRWSANVEAEGYPKVADGACHYVITEKSKHATGDIACGPFRRPEAAKDAVWDTLTFQREGDGAAKLTSLSTPGTALAAGTYLADADGREQTVDTSKVKEADYPLATLNMAWTSKDFAVDPADVGEPLPLAADPRLVGLGVAYRLESVRPVTKARTTAPNGVSRPSRVAEGDGMYLVRFSEVEVPNQLTGPNSLTVNISDTKVQIDGAPGSEVLVTTGASSTTEPSELLPVLTLDSDGVTQTLGLLSGERAGNPKTDPLYSVGYPQKADRDITINYPQVTGSDGPTYDLTVKVTSVQVTAYSGGWAPDGQLFATISFDGSASSTRVAGARYTIACTATVDGGEVTDCSGGVLGYATISATVPAGAPIGLHLAPIVKVDRDGTAVDVAFANRDAVVPLP